MRVHNRLFNANFDAKFEKTPVIMLFLNIFMISLMNFVLCYLILIVTCTACFLEYVSFCFYHQYFATLHISMF
jgi:hypothetical protein